MRIGELSERTGASVRSLRHYEANGLISARRDANGYRDFPESAVETVARIRALLAAGLPLATIRQMLPCTLDATPRLVPCESLISTLRAELDRLDARAAEIDRLRGRIAGLLATAAHPDALPDPGTTEPAETVGMIGAAAGRA